MSDECPCPQCQEGEPLVKSSRFAAMFAWAGRPMVYTGEIIPPRDTEIWADSSLSESRVFAMLDEDGGGWN